ncbi:hypothetical protein AAC387_Pa12g0457 [Persea americana]
MLRSKKLTNKNVFRSNCIDARPYLVQLSYGSSHSLPSYCFFFCLAHHLPSNHNTGNQQQEHESWATRTCRLLADNRSPPFVDEGSRAVVGKAWGHGRSVWAYFYGWVRDASNACGEQQEAVKDCFTTNDKALSNRASTAVAEHMGYNHAMFGLAPYGPYWREVHKIVML